MSLDWYIGRLTAEHGIISFTFFDSDALQKREKERATGKSILNSRAPDSSRGGSTARSQHRMGRLSLCCGGGPTGISNFSLLFATGDGVLDAPIRSDSAYEQEVRVESVSFSVKI